MCPSQMSDRRTTNFKENMPGRQDTSQFAAKDFPSRSHQALCNALMGCSSFPEVLAVLLRC